MKLVYDVHEKPKFGDLIVFAIQQLLAIMAATLVVPVITGNGMSSVAALFGAGIGTIVYLLFTKFKSPVFLGSSFAFLGSMAAAFAGGVSMALGYLGLIIGAVLAGLVYVVIAIVVKFAGVGWLNKLMPPVVIGPTVAIIGLSLAGNAVGDLQKGGLLAPVWGYVINGGQPEQIESFVPVANPLICLLVGIVTLFVTVLASTYGKRMAKLIPFIIGILAGYAVAAIFTIIGNVADIDALKVIDVAKITALWADGVNLSTFVAVPEFTFLTALGGFKELNATYFGAIAMAYVPVAFVVFAEHVADHKNISSIIGKDLLEEPGLSRTLLGDGVGSMAGAFFGGCPNTTYGESVACVAITRNASVATIVVTAVLAILISFLSPFVAFVNSIPSCVMGGVCVALYGFIAVSGLKMVQKVDLGQNKNLFVVSTILICGIGGLKVTFGGIQITAIATALILGIIVNLMLNKAKDEVSEEA
ncbi:MAG: uracil-xanthine permease [Clostridia bacterium]|nr:uracil-xanthine permease [Clostridia bacterium]